MEMSLLLHRGIWQHHRVIAIKIKFSFKSLVRNYELKSGTTGLEFRDLEEVNVSWSHPNVNAGAASGMLPDGAGGLQTMGWPWGPQGQGTCPCLLDDTGRSWGTQGGEEMDGPGCLGHGHLRAVPPLITHLGGKGTALPREGGWSRPHPWLPIRAVSIPVMFHGCPPALTGWQLRKKRRHLPIWVFHCVCHGTQKQQGLSPAMQLELPRQFHDREHL